VAVPDRKAASALEGQPQPAGAAFPRILPRLMLEAFAKVLVVAGLQVARQDVLERNQSGELLLYFPQTALRARCFVGEKARPFFESVSRLLGDAGLVDDSAHDFPQCWCLVGGNSDMPWAHRYQHGSQQSQMNASVSNPCSGLS
jgi:hypothetical protein